MAEQNRKSSRSKASLTRHPLFPAIVALWFGALFCLGSLAVRASSIESLVLATHLDSLVPAAAPPLGLTARILLALVMAGIGGSIGALIARRIAGPAKQVQPRRRQWRAEAEEATIRAATFSGPERDARGPADTGRRRSLALAEDNAPRDSADSAPLPGGAQILDLAVVDLGGVDLDNIADRCVEQTVLPALSDEGPDGNCIPEENFATVDGREIVPENAASEDIAQAVPGDEEPDAIVTRQVTDPASLARPASAGESVRERFVPPQGSAAERIAGTDLDVLSNVELIERLALSLQRRRAVVAAAPIQAPGESVWREEAPIVENHPAIEVSATIEEAPPLAMPAAFRPIGFDEQDDDDHLSAFVPPRRFSMPAAFPEEAGIDDAGPDAAGSLHDSEGPVLTPLSVASLDEDEADDEAEVDEGRYSSLLDHSRPVTARQQFVRTGETDEDAVTAEPITTVPQAFAPPADVDRGPEAEPIAAQARTPEFNAAFAPLRRFDAPGRSPHAAAEPMLPATGMADPEDAEAALRSALASLQRMSGAA